ncbi:YhgE/Pip family protein [Neobacillus sp. LXY-1]|uniref:YhgE/Pip family protein n=1 Tax=Neobacillus sp. LXY-1 TaxID=3379133 RepID=UPI003EDF5A29
MKNILLKEELSTIFKNKKVLIPIIAVMFIPVLYAGMFLWAFWDPYGKMDHLPVAIVNNDKGAEMEGEHLKLGDDLVKKLKDSKQFDFKTVNKDQGYQDLKNQKYYMLIEIPKDFSENATTLMDKNPKKLELIYRPNESYNFLSAQIGGTAIDRIKTAVSEKVTETYAETIFEKVSELADGIKKASDGAGELSDGTVELDNGSKELNNGLSTLAEKSIEFNTGMKTADAGAGKLSSGSNELYNGLATLAEKSIVFNTGMKTANAGAGKLSSGSNELFNGLATLAEKSIEFDQGVKTASSGSQTLTEGSSQVKNGLATVDSKLPELVSGTDKVYQGAEQLKEQLPAGIAEGMKTQLSSSVGELNKGIDSFESQLTASLSQQIAKQTLAQQSASMQQLAEALIKNGANPAIVQGVFAQAQAAAPTQEQLQAQIAANLKPGLDSGFEQFKTGVNQKLLGATTGLEEQIRNQTNPYFDSLINGIGAVNTGQKDLQSGIHQLYTGSVALNTGAQQLTNGMTQLSSGADQLTAGAGKLATGSNQLKNGATDLASGMTQLSGGSDQLTAGAGKLATGSNELKNGATDLASGMNQLTAGSGAITDGAGKLADGSNQLKDGTTKLSDGANELATKLSDGAEQASKVHADNKTYNMMAKPVKLEKDRLNKVPNYGTGFAPYFLSLGLFVGALLLSIVFPIREAAIRPSSGFNWFFSKFAIMAAVGIVQALVADAILLWGLDLHVQSEPKFMLFSILTSLTFVTLIQLLVSALADVGRFVAIVILIFQLTTSAGTFPLELIPNFLQHFNAFLPMTYTVSGFKAVISSGDYSFMWENFMILLSFTLGFALLTIVTYSMKLKSKHKTLISE